MCRVLDDNSSAVWARSSKIRWADHVMHFGDMCWTTALMNGVSDFARYLRTPDEEGSIFYYLFIYHHMGNHAQ